MVQSNSVAQQPPPFLTKALSCLLLMIGGVSAAAQASTAERWSERSYGVSLMPPVGANRVEGQNVRWDAPQGYSIEFEIVTSETPVLLQQFAESSLVQMGFAQSTPRLLDAAGEPTEKPPISERIGDRPAIRMYFIINETDKPAWFNRPGSGAKRNSDWFYGQTIIMLEPHAAVVLKLYASLDAAPAGREALEKVLASIQVPLGDELNLIREQHVQAGDDWLQKVSTDALRGVLPTDQWYRLILGDQDVGHVHLRSSSDPADLRRFKHEPPGTFVLIEKREYLDAVALDTRTELFLHDDGRRELWTTKTTLRPPGPAPGNNQQGGGLNRPGLPQLNETQAVTWAETGLRGDQTIHGQPVNAITVVSEAPPASAMVRQVEAHERFVGKPVKNDVRGRVATQEWVAPDRAYLSQIHVWVLGALLPAEEAVYCFSAYHPPSGQPGLHTVEVKPQPDGGLIVLDRPTSRLGPTRSVYDAQRRLVERVWPGGLRLVPTTPEDLAGVWGITVR